MCSSRRRRRQATVITLVVVCVYLSVGLSVCLSVPQHTHTSTGKIRDSNRPTLLALYRSWLGDSQAHVKDFGIVR